jgi:hypothetical protein
VSQSHMHRPALSRRGDPTRESATTAAGIAAERVALADRERERRASRARTAARRVDGPPTASKP